MSWIGTMRQAIDKTILRHFTSFHRGFMSHPFLGEEEICHHYIRGVKIMVCFTRFCDV